MDKSWGCDLYMYATYTQVITVNSGITSFGGVDHHGHAGRHGVDHYQRLHTPNKILYGRLHSFPGPFDDDDGYHNIGRLKYAPLSVVLKLYRYKRHPIGEYDIWLQLRYS